MVIAGRDIERAEGSDQPTDVVEVTRLDPAPITGGAVEAGAVPDMALAIPLDDTEEAVAAAIRATEQGLRPAAPAPEPAVETASNSVAGVEAVTPDYWYVTGNRVNLRQGPSTATSVIGQVTYGQKAEVLEETADGWYRIETVTGSDAGYIFGRFLSPNAPL